MPVYNPILDVIRAGNAGLEAGQMIQRASMERAEMERMKKQRAQEDFLRELQLRQTLAQVARPVSAAGTVDLPAPGIPGMPGMTAKAARDRTVEFGGQKYELKTPDEQYAESRGRRRAEKQEDLDMEAGAKRQERQFVDQHGVVRDALSVPLIVNENNLAQHAEQFAAETSLKQAIEEARLKQEAAQKDADRKNRVAIAESSAKSRERAAAIGANSRIAAAQVGAERPARIDNVQNDRQIEAQLGQLEKDAFQLKQRGVVIGQTLASGEMVDPKTGTTRRVRTSERQLLEEQKKEIAARLVEMADRAKRLKGLTSGGGGRVSTRSDGFDVDLIDQQLRQLGVRK